MDITLPIFKINTKTAAGELRETAHKVKSMSKAERQYAEMLKDARSIAEQGGTEMPMKTMKKNFFEDNFNPETLGALRTKEDVVNEYYVAQSDVLDMFRKNGFSVTENEPELPSLLSLGLDAASSMKEARAKQEAAFISRYVEKDVVISWK